MRTTSRMIRRARRQKDRSRIANLEERRSAALTGALDEVETFAGLVGRAGFDLDGYLARIEAGAV